MKKIIIFVFVCLLFIGCSSKTTTNDVLQYFPPNSENIVRVSSTWWSFTRNHIPYLLYYHYDGYYGGNTFFIMKDEQVLINKVVVNNKVLKYGDLTQTFENNRNFISGTYSIDNANPEYKEIMLDSNMSYESAVDIFIKTVTK